ncbi:hypothetical protein F441_20709 [Phytophthora nicotianae CJ01A1]|uniref:Uncharacterized protein n=3 Tax=Phytophthora nicotianae TaxID=4792 RepID=V9E176_PHYNI|nr:hypothetical protein F443_20845 [Phytophthora nicotianae P1569]ETO61034.1 hypothetical protein F444_20870 [Phytophthora nicotianae P1976]ETP02150.1 hypothetical protein F441_20709 [Phytophthora nicotianae CJ01A1]
MLQKILLSPFESVAGHRCGASYGVVHLHGAGQSPNASWTRFLPQIVRLRPQIGQFLVRTYRDGVEGTGQRLGRRRRRLWSRQQVAQRGSATFAGGKSRRLRRDGYGRSREPHRVIVLVLGRVAGHQHVDRGQRRPRRQRVRHSRLVAMQLFGAVHSKSAKRRVNVFLRLSKSFARRFKVEAEDLSKRVATAAGSDGLRLLRF